MSGPTRNRLHSKGETMDRAILNIALCALLAVAACAFASGSSAQGLSSADLTRFRSIGSVAVSPEASRRLYRRDARPPGPALRPTLAPGSRDAEVLAAGRRKRFQRQSAMVARRQMACL